MGCPRNLVDSETILSRLFRKGYTIGDIDGSDVAVVNTCAFVEDAKKESIDVILDLIDLKKEGKLRKIIVCGCLSQRYKDELRKELPEVDAFVGRLALPGSKRLFSLTPKHYEYLKICEGCINTCSYCVIPGIKSAFTSETVDSIIGKVKDADRRRVSELNIIGQDITGYGIDLFGSFKLENLLKDVVRHARRIGWIRLLYLYPTRVSDELLAVMRDNPQVCRYIDIPIQHCSDRILKLMNRRMTKKDIIGILQKVRKSIPGVALRTAVITGFPSETDKEFKEMLAFISEMKFERLGAFMYSREEGTNAFHLKKQVPKHIKEARFNRIMLEQQKVSRENNAKLMGKVLSVLIDSEENGVYLGRTEYDAPEVDGTVYVSSATRLSPGEFVKVEINDTMEYDLSGSVVGKEAKDREFGK